MTMDGVTIFKNARIISEGKISEGDLLVIGDKIEKIDSTIDHHGVEIDCNGNYLMPGIIDDQVHFREPGLTHKATIATESRAAVAGGVTSFMEMPNTNPPATTLALLENKYDIARNCSPANYSFFLGATEHNLSEILSADYYKICGVKIFMGSSTGSLIVEDDQALEQIFAQCPALIATHCEDEFKIRTNLEKIKHKYGELVSAAMHPQIRTAEGCYLSSFKATSLAKKYGTRLHILHISTEKEISLFNNAIDRKVKRITAEACVHHMYFDQSDYALLGNKIKCNPAIKRREDKEAILQAVLDGYIDVIATDHAPHTFEEKSKPYFEAPAGLPLVQHTLLIMLSHYKNKKISLEQIIDKMCHAPADIFQITERGYLKEGFKADIVLFNTDQTTRITKENLLYKCAWSPLEGKEMNGRILSTWVNGQLVFDGQKILGNNPGERLNFDFTN